MSIEFKGRYVDGKTTFEIWHKQKELGLIWYASNKGKWILSLHGHKNLYFDSSKEARAEAKKLLKV